MVDSSALQNLNLQDQIVTPEGTATQFFMRLLQRKNAFSGNLSDLIAWLNTFAINTTTPIVGGPVTLGADAAITISHADSGVAAGSYTNANITVDAKGHITAAVNGSGGSGGKWGPVVDGSFPPVFVQNPDGSLVLAEYV